MAKWIANNQAIDEYIRQLNKLNEDTEKIIEKAIYPAAGIMADEIKQAIQALPVIPPNFHGSSEHPLEGVTKKQKDGLLSGFGISHFKNENGFINVKMGFDGYNSVKTKKYPQGQPNIIIARSVNSGTSFRKKTMFIDKAYRKAKTKVQEEIEKNLEKEIKKIMK